MKALIVGEETKDDSLPLNTGQRIYELRSLKESAWYEVRISYPASIRATFSIQLKTGALELWSSKNGRLLNTEKLVFKADGHRPVYVAATVEAEGVVAKPNAKERELAVFNIVCDELMIGIPHHAWLVGVAGLLCLVWHWSFIFPPTTSVAKECQFAIK